MSESWTVARMGSQVGKRFLVTGANSGIGFKAAVELARWGAVVVLACRDTGRGAAALKRLRAESAGPGSAGEAAELVALNLASLQSVRAVAAAECARGMGLDGLVNNAGVFSPPRRKVTEDGFELQWGTNVLGHFALTCGLMAALERAGAERGAARVVTVASIAHKPGRLQFEDLQSEKSYRPQGAYQQSKLGDLMMALALERKLRARGSRVMSVAVHPGVARSNLFKVGNGRGLAGVAERGVAKLVGWTLNDDAEGALPTLFGAVAAEAKGGEYYGPQGWLEMRGGDVGTGEDIEAGTGRGGAGSALGGVRGKYGVRVGWMLLKKVGRMRADEGLRLR